MEKSDNLDVSERATLDVTIISLSGFIDQSNAGKLEARFRDLISKKNYKLVVDMGKLTFVSSAGWSVFISFLRTLRENGGSIKLANMSKEVEAVFNMMEFSEIMDKYPNDIDALDAFRAH